MSEVKVEKSDGSVGVVTRADLSAVKRQAQEIVKEAQDLRDGSRGAEDAAAKAEPEMARQAREVDGLADLAPELAAPPAHEVDVWGVDVHTGQPMPRPGAPAPPPGQAGPLSPAGGPAGGPPGGAGGAPGGAGAGAPAFRRLPVPNLYPRGRRSPGGLPQAQPALWARGVGAAGGLAAKGMQRLDAAGKMGLGATAAWMGKYFMQAPGLADRYDEEISRQIAQLGRTTPMNAAGRWSVDKSPGWGTRWDKAEGDNTIAFRAQMNRIRDLFQMTGGEFLAMTRELGPLANQRRAVAGTAMIAREYGLDTGRAGRLQRTFHDYTDTGRRGAYSTRDSQQPIGHYMAYGGMRDRAETFIDDAEGYAKVMGGAQGSADSGAVLGYTAWLGSIGLGNRKDIGRQLLNGASARGDDMVHAMKIRAVREFLGSERVIESNADGRRTVRQRGGFTLGAGRGALRLDPSQLWDAELIIDSKDPRILHAYARFARKLARERGVVNPDEYAKSAFARMAGVGPAVAQKVWRETAALETPELLTKEPEKDVTWTEGPYHDAGGKEGKISGAVRAAMDIQQHALGHGMNYLLRSATEALKVTVQVMQESGRADNAIIEGLYVLDPALLELGIVAGGLSGTAGGKAKAATLATVLATRDVKNLPGNVLDFAEERAAVQANGAATASAVAPDAPAANESPRPHPTGGAGDQDGGAILRWPAPGGAPGQDMGAPRYRHGHKSHDHQGLDLFAPVGSPVVAAGAGTVEFVRGRRAWERLPETNERGRGAGIMAIVRHPDGTVTKYMHLDAIAEGIKKGTRVESGQQLGSVGRTGIWNPKTGSHLHFEVKNAQGETMSPTSVLGRMSR